MIKISVSLSGHKTSINIEKEFYDVLKYISKQKNKKISEIINYIDINRTKTNLSSELRVWILKEIMKISKL